MSHPNIRVYSMEWCPACRTVEDWLREHHFLFEKILVEQNPDAMALVKKANGDACVVPTVAIGDVFLSLPSEEILKKHLLPAEGQAPRELDADCLIIGGGPAGLTAAIYLARERKKVIVLEKGIPGGQIMNTHMVENYPGFPDGVSGPELVERLVTQATRFGAEIRQLCEVTGVREEDGVKIVSTSKGELAAPALIVAVGSDYRQINVPGSHELAGRGISYCATCDGPFFKGKHVVLIGGGNTAVQEATFLTRFVKKMTILHRSAAFTAEQILCDDLMQHRDMLDIRFHTEVEAFLGEKKLTAVRTRHRETGVVEEITADGAFVFIGRVPNTGFLKEVLCLTKSGFIDVDQSCPLQSKMRGIFGAGDCMGDSHAQLTTATADGTVASFFVREYLQRLGR